MSDQNSGKNTNTNNSTKKRFILCFLGQKSYVNVAPTQTLANVRQLLHQCLDACQLPDEEYLFRLDGILVSSKQEEEHCAFEILERAATVELVPISNVRKRKLVAESANETKEEKCDKSSEENASLKERHPRPTDDVFADKAGILHSPSPHLVAQLSKNPRTLHRLWQEYMFGIGGNKPAKDFTSRERGALRFKYYKRNVFWKQVSELILAGYTANVAIDKIYQCYGVGSATTSIINAMIRDKKIGGHPNLRAVEK